MFRALLTLQGTLDVLSPGYPIVDAAEMLGAAMVVKHVDPRALPDLVRDEVLRVAPRSPSPGPARHPGRGGELHGQVSFFADPPDAR